MAVSLHDHIMYIYTYTYTCTYNTVTIYSTFSWVYQSIETGAAILQYVATLLTEQFDGTQSCTYTRISYCRCCIFVTCLKGPAMCRWSVGMILFLNLLWEKQWESKASRPCRMRWISFWLENKRGIAQFASTLHILYLDRAQHCKPPWPSEICRTFWAARECCAPPKCPAAEWGEQRGEREQAGKVISLEMMHNDTHIMIQLKIINLTCLQKLNIVEISFDAAGQERNYWNTAGKAGEEYFLLEPLSKPPQVTQTIYAEKTIETQTIETRRQSVLLFVYKNAKWLGTELRLSSWIVHPSSGAKMGFNMFQKICHRSITNVYLILSNPYICYDSKTAHHCIHTHRDTFEL